MNRKCICGKCICGVAAVFVAAASAWGQFPVPGGGTTSGPSAPAGQATFPADMAITVGEVEVRSGPTTKYYPTSKLRMGDRVQVLRESKDQPGWLAIRPPAGSFSWIKAKFVKHVNAQTGYIPEDTPAVPVMPGSSLTNQPPNVESVKLQPGSQVVILDRPFQVEGEVWLPIQPPPTEVRFIPADAVRLPSAAPPVQVAPSGFPTNVGGANLIAQADQAYQSGNKELARQLYQQAANDPNQQVVANQRLNTLRLIPTTPVWQPAHPGQQNPVMRTAVNSTPQGTVPTGTQMSLTQPARWSEWGYLRQTSMVKDGQPVFVLENKQGQPLLYAIAQPGTSLRDYLGRREPVCLFGPITYRSEDYPRVQYMVASHVALP